MIDVFWYLGTKTCDVFGNVVLVFIALFGVKNMFAILNDLCVMQLLLLFINRIRTFKTTEN